MHWFRAVRACLFCLMFMGLVEQADAASLTVAWDRSPDTTVAGYVVSYGTQSRTYTSTVVAGNSTSVVLPGLADAATYYIVVQAYNSEGTRGTPSIEVVGQTPAGPLSVTCPSPVVTSPDGKPTSVSLLLSSKGGTAPIAVGCTPASGSLFKIGTTPFSCTATDAIKQTASCASTVVVLAPAVALAPTPPPPGTPATVLAIACPVIADVTAPGNNMKAIVRFSDPVVSGGRLPVAVSCTPRSGSLFDTGTTQVSCAATDAVQNVAACVTTATVLAPPRRGQ